MVFARYFRLTMLCESYAELHCYSNFSFLKGASHPEELVVQAARLNYQALAITDECSLAGVVRAHVAAKEQGIKLIIGSELKTEDGFHFIAIAPNRLAYGQLSALISKARRRANKGCYELHSKDLQHGFSACLCIWFPTEAQCIQWQSQTQTFTQLFEQRLWVGVENHLNQQQV